MLEAGETIRLVRERVGQDLDRHVPVQPCIARSIHLAHPAFADLLGDGEHAEARAWGQGHGCGL